MISPSTESVVYTTWLAFKAKVRKIGWPEGIGEQVKYAHDSYMVNAIIKAQRFIECLRNTQATFYYKQQSNDNCGISTILGPRGRISAVYAFKPGENCKKFFYNSKTPQFVSCWSANNSCQWENPDTIEYQNGAEVCYPYYESGTEEDDDCWVAADKYYAKDNQGNLYLAPRFPCGYIVAVHWQGIRRHWENNDSIPDDEDLAQWVATETMKDMALFHDRDPQRHRELQAESREKFADLMYWCNEERKIQVDRDCTTGIDTGNLNQMFPPIYPLPTSDAANPYPTA